MQIDDEDYDDDDDDEDCNDDDLFLFKPITISYKILDFFTPNI